MDSLPPLDCAGRRRSRRPCPAITVAGRLVTKACGIPRTHPLSRRSSRSCATPARTQTAFGYAL